MMILLAIIPLSKYTDLAIPFSAVDRSRFCPRGIARRPGCASGLSDVAAEKIGARSRTAASRCERGAIVACFRVAASATRARAGNSAISHLPPRTSKKSCSKLGGSKAGHIWGVAGYLEKSFSNLPYL